jgi:hypothetical protein
MHCVARHKNLSWGGGGRSFCFSVLSTFLQTTVSVWTEHLSLSSARITSNLRIRCSHNSEE